MLLEFLLCVMGMRLEGARLGELDSQLSLFPNTGDLESFKKQSFVLKEGVEYRIKISFRVRPGLGEVLGEYDWRAWLTSPWVPTGEQRDRVRHEVHPAHIQERRQE